MRITVMCVLAASSAAFAGNVNEAELVGTAVNNVLASAQSVNGSFTPNADPNVFGTGPTVSIAGHAGGDDVDFYSFTMNTAGRAWFDIDRTNEVFDSFLSLFDSSGTWIAFGDDIFDLDAGSATGLDSFIGEVALAAGDYYIAVTNFGNAPTAAGSNSSAAQLDRPDGYYGGEQIIGATPGDSAFWFNGNDAGLEYTLHITLSVVPLPSTAGLAMAGLLAVGVRRRR